MELMKPMETYFSIQTKASFIKVKIRKNHPILPSLLYFATASCQIISGVDRKIVLQGKDEYFSLR